MPNPTGWVDPFGLSCKEELQKLLNEDPDRAYFKIREMIRNNSLDFSTKKEGAVFWSGTGNMRTAQGFGELSGKTTLEQTKGGKILDELDLFNKMDPNSAAKLWNMASNKFAQGATGKTFVFNKGATQYGAYGERTWSKIEQKILQKNNIPILDNVNF